MPDSGRPVVVRDCLDCGFKEGMRLQNAVGTTPTNIPLLYICAACGCMFTVPPARSPLRNVKPREEP